MNRVLVCGSREAPREYAKIVFQCLALLHTKHPINHIISGGATGVDTYAIEWAQQERISHSIYYAQWDKFGKAAGPQRNALMLREGVPNIVVAFAGGRGTENMVKQAEQQNLKIWRP